jgi:hypothetical protein
MQCQHNRTVKVELEPANPPWWDDGVMTYDAEGKEKTTKEGQHFVTVTGCEQCKLIEVE